MSKRLACIGAALCVALMLILSACGGGKTVTTTRTVTAAAPAPQVSGKALPASSTGQAPQLVCPPRDLIMQCVLAQQPPPPKMKLGANPRVRYGIDFGWSTYSIPFLKSIGADFVAGYLSTDFSKNLPVSYIPTLKRAGMGIVLVYETYANRAAGGPIAGAIDAGAAAQQARDRGNFTGPIEFAIDFDARGWQVDGYFRTIHRILGDRTNAYGGYYPLKYLCDHHLVGHENWMTYAWQAGNPWLPPSCAPLEQYLNGSAYDHDKAIADLYGQYTPRVGPDPLAIMDHTRRHFKVRAHSPVWGAPHEVVASEYRTMGTARRLGCHGKPRRRGCVTSLEHLLLLEGRLYTVSQHKHPHYANGRGARFRIMRKQIARMR